MPSLFTSLLALVTLAISYRLAGNAIHSWALKKFTAVTELKALGRPRGGAKLKGTAVVCGGSIGGLLAARVLADHYDEVVVVDPDNDLLTQRAKTSLPKEPRENAGDVEAGRQPRTRVMQARMLHGSQALNLAALDKLFSDFRAWLRTCGAVIAPLDADWMTMDGHLIHQPTEFFPPGQCPETFMCSRTAYENLLRSLVVKLPNVRFVNGTVSAVVPSAEDQGVLTVVKVRTDGGERDVGVDLVVDCSGSTGAGVTWLKRAGYPTPNKQTYNPHMRYYSIEFEVDPETMRKICPQGFDKDHHCILFTFNALDKEPNMFGFSQIEHNRIHLGGGGWGFKDKWTSVQDVKKHVSSLNQSEPIPAYIYELLDYLDGEPSKTADWNVAAPGAMYEVKYHEVSKLPRNFVALGDAVMKLNPVFGQGLTKAVIGATTLDGCLRRSSGSLGPDFAKDFFTRLHDKTDGAWNGTKYFDYLVPTTEPAADETRETGAGTRWYMKQLDELERQNVREVVYRKFMMMQWMAPPTALFAPSMVGRVMWHVLSKKVVA